MTEELTVLARAEAAAPVTATAPAAAGPLGYPPPRDNDAHNFSPAGARRTTHAPVHGAAWPTR